MAAGDVCIALTQLRKDAKGIPIDELATRATSLLTDVVCLFSDSQGVPRGAGDVQSEGLEALDASCSLLRTMRKQAEDKVLRSGSLLGTAGDAFETAALTVAEIAEGPFQAQLGANGKGGPLLDTLCDVLALCLATRDQVIVARLFALAERRVRALMVPVEGDDRHRGYDEFVNKRETEKRGETWSAAPNVCWALAMKDFVQRLHSFLQVEFYTGGDRSTLSHERRVLFVPLACSLGRLYCTRFTNAPLRSELQTLIGSGFEALKDADAERDVAREIFDTLVQFPFNSLDTSALLNGLYVLGGPTHTLAMEFGVVRCVSEWWRVNEERVCSDTEDSDKRPGVVFAADLLVGLSNRFVMTPAAFIAQGGFDVIIRLMARDLLYQERQAALVNRCLAACIKKGAARELWGILLSVNNIGTLLDYLIVPLWRDGQRSTSKVALRVLFDDAI